MVTLRLSAMLLKAQNHRKMTHFIATCGRALKQRKMLDELCFSDGSTFHRHLSLSVYNHMLIINQLLSLCRCMHNSDIGHVQQVSQFIIGEK